MNSAFKYSIPWKNVNNTPRRIVIKINIKDLFNFFFKNKWWDQVIDAPDESKIIEFIIGIPIGLNVSIPDGGHINPSSTLGEILLWKNAQKNLKKNMISEMINIIILNFKSFIVVKEWFPWKEDSRLTSRHHINIFSEININIINKNIVLTFLLKSKEIIEIVIDKREKDKIIGHGLGVVKWKGFLIFVI